MVVVSGHGKYLGGKLPPVLVLISGPAQAGKTRAGRLLAAYLNADHFALSDELKDMTHRHYGLPVEMNVNHYENCKDTECDEFGGLSPRQAYIDFSEGYLKPRYGSGYLGEKASSRVSDNLREGRITIISGVGFLDEIFPLVAAAGTGGTLHLRILPRNMSNGQIDDSRTRLDLGRYGVEELEIESTNAFSLANMVRYRLRNMMTVC